MVTLPEMTTEDYRHLLERCVHCGLCLEACPTYALFGTEMDAPRGRIVLMRAAAAGQLDRSTLLGPFAEHLTLCLECRACESACPSHVPYGRLIEGARIALETLRTPGLPERFLNWLGMAQLMPHVGRLRWLARLLWLYERSGLQWLVRTLNVLPPPLKAMENILPPLTLHRPDYSRPAPAMGERRGKVAFFYGCVQDAFLAAINAATIRVLQRNGYEVHFPRGQTCCGAAQWHTGHKALAERLARQNIDAFLADDYLAVVNNAGGCGLTLKEYPILLADDPVYAEKARRFAAKVQDFSEFLAAHLHVPPRGELRVRAVFADSCHLRHGQGVIRQPRDLLRAIPGLELVELRDPDRCCGSAGIYNIVRHETATAILDAKMADIASTGAEVVVTANTGCHMQLLAGVRRARLNVHVLHVAEMLDMAYRADDRRLRERVRHPRPLLADAPLPRRWLSWLARRVPRREHAARPFPPAPLPPGQVVDDPLGLLTYQVDAGLDRGEPWGVLFPYTEDEARSVVRWAARERIPLIARGAGTGLAGGAVAERGGLLLAFTQMRQVLELDVEGRCAVVQPGVVNLTLQRLAEQHGLYFPPDPAGGRAATLGGNVATNAGGPHCLKYGVMAPYVVGLDVIWADGSRSRLGGRALDYPELDLVGLVTGSEGTLAVVVGITLRLVRQPPAVRTLWAAFESVERAGEAVSAVIAAGLLPAAMEMMDRRMVHLVEAYRHTGLPLTAGAVIVADVDGYPAGVGPQIEELAALLRAHGATEVHIAQSDGERAEIWQARKSSSGALARVALDHYTVDGTVPRSKLAGALREVRRICEALSLDVVFVLHAGDGNLHPMILVPDPEDEAHVQRVREAGRRIAAHCVALGGTITGEHGVGIEKRDFMPLMYDEDVLAAMREIKALFDPHGILNPGKLFPVAPQERAAGPRPSPLPPPSAGAEVVSPTSAEEAASLIRALVAGGKRVRVRGGGTKSALLPPTDVRLSTVALAGVREYARDDLYVTVGAGTTWGALQAALEGEPLWVPLHSPWPGATVGGLVSTAWNAPLRMRYGSLRDLVLAMTVVLPDGRTLRLGRPVMKNVAGYDLSKLFIGSHGALGLVVEVTFKLVPRPRAVATYAIPVASREQGASLGRRLMRRTLVASAVQLCRGRAIPSVDAPYALLFTAEGLPWDVEAELVQVRQVAEAVGLTPQPSPLSGTHLWGEWLAAPTTAGYLVRVGVAPRAVGRAVVELPAEVDFLADFWSGHIYVRGAEASLPALRGIAERHGGYAVILDAASTLRQGGVDRWGYRPDAWKWMRAIHARWNPSGLFNPDAFNL